MRNAEPVVLEQVALDVILAGVDKIPHRWSEVGKVRAAGILTTGYSKGSGSDAEDTEARQRTTVDQNGNARPKRDEERSLSVMLLPDESSCP
jgi:hypothetical protein